MFEEAVIVPAGTPCPSLDTDPSIAVARDWAASSLPCYEEVVKYATTDPIFERYYSAYLAGKIESWTKMLGILVLALQQDRDKKRKQEVCSANEKA